MYTGISMPLLSESNQLPALQVHSQRPPPCILLNAAQGLERIQQLGSHGFQHFRHQQRQHTTQQREHGRMKNEVPLLHGLWVLLFRPNTESKDQFCSTCIWIVQKSTEEKCPALLHTCKQCLSLSGRATRGQNALVPFQCVVTSTSPALIQ